MLIRKKSFDLSLDSLSDTMTNVVGILILMLLSVTLGSVRDKPGISWEKMRQAQAQCAHIESRQSQLQQQWQELKVNEEEKRTELERLQAKLNQLQYYADMPQDELSKSRALDPDALQTLLRVAANKREKVAEMQRALAGTYSKLDTARKALRDRKTAMALEEEIEPLRKAVNQLGQKQEKLEEELARARNDQTRVAELRKELEMLKGDIPQLQQELEKRKSSAQWPTGTYSGPYVLVECNDSGAVVYPEKRQLPVDAPEDLKNWLREQVRNTGAALVIARPSSFEKSYARFKRILTQLARDEKAKGEEDKAIVLTFWPIEEHTSIEKYMPKGNTHE